MDEESLLLNLNTKSFTIILEKWRQFFKRDIGIYQIKTNKKLVQLTEDNRIFNVNEN